MMGTKRKTGATYDATISYLECNDNLVVNKEQLFGGIESTI